ncbi:MAG TPA: response regulator transcription factor [Pseudonocardia sp.]
MADDRSVDIHRVVVVDGHRMFAEALTMTLSAEDDLRVVGSVAPADPDLPGVLGRLRPDVAIVDVARLGVRSAALLDIVSGAVADVRIVVLTGSQDVGQVVDAARAGALAWVSKERPSADLVATIRAVCAGHACYPPDYLGVVLRALARPSAPRADRLAVLSRQERRVLACMVDGATGPELAAELHVSPGTVRTHIQKIFTKLGVHSRLEAVRIAREAGMRPGDAAIMIGHDCS